MSLPKSFLYRWFSSNASMGFQMSRYQSPFVTRETLETWRKTAVFPFIKGKSIVKDGFSTISRHSSSTFVYKETGMLMLDNRGEYDDVNYDNNNVAYHEIKRTYIYKFDMENNLFQVFHGDPVNNLFFEQDFNDKESWILMEDAEEGNTLISPLVEHICGNDIYRGFQGWNIKNRNWITVWSVQGPQKSYCLQTCFIAM